MMVMMMPMVVVMMMMAMVMMVMMMMAMVMMMMMMEVEEGEEKVVRVLHGHRHLQDCTLYQVSSPMSAPLVTDQTGKLFILLFGCHQQTTVEHGEHTQQLRLYEVNLHSRSCDCHMTSM